MRVEIQILDNGDIYINGEKRMFAVDFDPHNPRANVETSNVKWLVGWAKIGLMSHGYDVPHFHIRPIESYGSNLQPMVGDKGP